MSTEIEKVEKAEKPVAEQVRYSMSGGFVAFLTANKISIAATSYQSGRLYLLGRNPKGGLMVNESFFRRAMGLCYHEKSLFFAAFSDIVRLENILLAHQSLDRKYTDCFVPRTSHHIGRADAHDVVVDKDGRIIFVATGYNCLATIDPKHSFNPIWKPDFISTYVAEDRCHLNGLALRDGEARYVSMVSKSDTIDGWRDRRADGGVVIDIKSDEVICEGLSMPHSPRFYDGKLWLLNSGTGELGYVDEKKKAFQPVMFCPGFVRGLSFHNGYAFVGLSRPRYERFEGLALEEKLRAADSNPWTGLQVIDLAKKQCVQWFRVDGPVFEMYDVAVLPDIGCAKAIGPQAPDRETLVTLPQDFS